jgi:hypothetical protein
MTLLWDEHPRHSVYACAEHADRIGARLEERVMNVIAYPVAQRAGSSR